MEDPLDDDVDSSAVEWHQQSISQDEMIRGLRAAAKVRPRLVIENSLMTTDPWAAGIAHLQTMAPLKGFSLSQWQRVQHGCAALLASHGAEMTRLGWTAEDAFGVHPDVPSSAAHAWGLGVVLGDSRVIEMTEKGARIERPNGVRQSFTRHPSPWAVPIWMAGSGGAAHPRTFLKPFP